MDSTLTSFALDEPSKVGSIQNPTKLDPGQTKSGQNPTKLDPGQTKSGQNPTKLDPGQTKSGQRSMKYDVESIGYTVGMNFFLRLAQQTIS
jgi:hypothetical protein